MNRPSEHIGTTAPLGNSERRLSKIASIGLCKCPRCRKGNMFMYRTWHMNGFAKMYDECPHCGQDFQIEPGFYMMASYIGYINFVVMIVVLAFSGFAIFPESEDYITISACIGLTLLLISPNFRLSRSLNLSLFGGIRYHPGAGNAESGLFIGPGGDLQEGDPREEYRPKSR
jgi:uncharacterized protein (DUF983 family)